MVQWTEDLKSKLRGLSTYQDIEENNDVIWFLLAIKEVAFKCETQENTHVYLWNMKKRTVNTYKNYLDPVKYL